MFFRRVAQSSRDVPPSLCTQSCLVRCAILCLERALESRNGQHERTAWEWPGTCDSQGCCAVCFAVHFGIQTGSIG